jgi:hypothetical protein
LIRLFRSYAPEERLFYKKGEYYQTFFFGCGMEGFILAHPIKLQYFS